MRVMLAQINPTIGDIQGNLEKILLGIQRARQCGACIVLFPELAICGYPPEDFLLMPHFYDRISHALDTIVKASTGIAVIVGMPRCVAEEGEKPLRNSAGIIENGVLLGFQDKMLLPTYDVFDERRFFEPASEYKLWSLCGQRVGVTICEDIWQHSELIKSTAYVRDPVDELVALKPDFVLNLSASPFNVGKFANRLHVCEQAAKTLRCPLFLCNQVGGNDSLIFEGRSICVDGYGHLVDCTAGFAEDYFCVDLAINSGTKALSKAMVHELNVHPTEDIYNALVLGVRDYFHKSGFTKACLGLSGGVDSALVACIAAAALGKENILGLMMPSRYSSSGSIHDALQLANVLGIECREVPIESVFQSYLDLLNPYFAGRAPNVTEENLQARIRGMVLMAFANKLGYLVLSTGNKSELAMGYSTLYGDMCGGLAVISDVTKQQVYEVSKWINRDKEIIPWSTIHKAPSAELRPNQKDSDSLPDYAVVDNVLQAYIEQHLSPELIAERFGYSLEVVKDLVRRIHVNEYKRRQSPPGLRISEKAFSVGRRFPIVQGFVK